MKALGAALAAFVLLAQFSAAVSQSTVAAPLIARHKTGPVTIRGVATRVHPGSFTLTTRSHGTYTVTLKFQTTVTEKGKHGGLSIVNGDHVSVRGLVTGQTIVAITVRIIPSKKKPKQSTVRGTVQAASTSQVVVSAEGKGLTIQITSATEVRIGSQIATLRQVKPGDRVQVRIQSDGKTTVALRIHVFKPNTIGKHLQLRGVVLAVQPRDVSIDVSGKRYRVGLTTDTSVRMGTAPASLRSLKSGQTVTVHACCLGSTLTASTIQIHAPAKVHSTVLKGTVSSISGTTVSIQSGRDRAVVVLDRSTVVERGTASSSPREIRVGDEVSIRALRHGAMWQALRVRIYTASRREHTIAGKVLSLSRAGFVLVEGAGKQYSVLTAGRVAVTVGTGSASAASVHAGDRVRVRGRLSGSIVTATSIRVSVAKAALKTIRGIVRTTSGAELLVVDNGGMQYQVQVNSGVHILLRGQPAPSSAVFPGVRVHARGSVVGKTLHASSITISVQNRSVKGRIERIAGTRLQLRASRGSTWAIDMPSTAMLMDGGRRLSTTSLHSGGWATAQGYVVKPLALRAIRVDLIHPQITLRATVVSTSGGVTVQTPQGERYKLRLAGGVKPSTGRVNVDITFADIPVGARVSVHGIVGSDGTVQVDRLTVRLAAVTTRGQITALHPQEASMQASGASYRLKLSAHTTFMQGSHTLTIAEVVMGDDVTVYGYRINGGVVLARKILVHRKRMSLTGTVMSVSPDGFVLSADDGSHRVMVTAGTVVVTDLAQVPTVGQLVRVSGYLRGDGVLLAARITVKRKR